MVPGTEKPEIRYGLEGVYMTESSVCKVDGLAGRLYYRGYSIETLAENSSFEEVCYLLVYGILPRKDEFERFRNALVDARELQEPVIRTIKDMVAAGRSDSMDILRTCVSMLPAYEDGAYARSDEANMGSSVNMISKIAIIIATISRYRKGKGYISSDRSLGHVENFLYLMNDKRPSKEDARLLETIFILQAEHSLNASTFAALVAGSTLADLYAAITAGISALKGPLHGGANEQTLKMLRAIGKPENAPAYINDALSRKEKVMGFGHRVYKTYDPRARIIKDSVMRIKEGKGGDARMLADIALSVEGIMVERLGPKGIWPNVDFFSGIVYTAVGIEPDMFTPIFAASRIPGWCAHMTEYWHENRLLRPLDYYTGRLDLEYVPIDKR